MTQKSKYAYNKNYYENLRRRSVYDGNAVRKFDAVNESYEEDEEFEEESAYGYDFSEPVRRESRESERRVRRGQRYETESEPKVKTRWKIDINPVYTLTMVVAVCALLITSFLMLETRSDIIQTEKKIGIAKNELADVNALNESLKASLDTQMDRNYIYSMAVARLGMVYPNDNETVTYRPADGGYVHQISSIP